MFTTKAVPNHRDTFAWELSADRGQHMAEKSFDTIMRMSLEPLGKIQLLQLYLLLFRPIVIFYRQIWISPKEF
jgi:hypothetical protein